MFQLKTLSLLISNPFHYSRCLRTYFSSMYESCGYRSRSKSKKLEHWNSQYSNLYHVSPLSRSLWTLRKGVGIERQQKSGNTPTYFQICLCSSVPFIFNRNTVYLHQVKENLFKFNYYRNSNALYSKKILKKNFTSETTNSLPELVLYKKDPCPLCDEALEKLSPYLDQVKFMFIGVYVEAYNFFTI